MKKLFFLLMLFIANGVLLKAQTPNALIQQGNKDYDEKKYSQAQKTYQQATTKDKNGNLPQSVFNLGDAYYQQNKFDSAQQQFQTIINSQKDPSIKSQAYHNLGNTLLKQKKYEESIDAYKNSLKMNPSDKATKYNLAYAMDMLQQKKKQQQQQQQKNNNQNNDQQQQKQQQQQQQQQKQQQKQQQQQQEQPKNKLSDDDAKRLLQALDNEESKAQQDVKNKKTQTVQGNSLKDW
jgi:Ca-activated chloride channel homolog